MGRTDCVKIASGRAWLDCVGICVVIAIVLALSALLSYAGASRESSGGKASCKCGVYRELNVLICPTTESDGA